MAEVRWSQKRMHDGGA